MIFFTFFLYFLIDKNLHFREVACADMSLDSERLLHYAVSRYCAFRNRQAKKIDVLKEIRVDVEKSSVFDEGA